MEEKVSRRGRPSRDDLKERAERPQPQTAHPEDVKLRLLRPTDERADVKHYWARVAFYQALRDYAPAAYDELAQAVKVHEEATYPPTHFGQLLTGIDEPLLRLCRKYEFLVDGKEGVEEDRDPAWLSQDIFDSFWRWWPKQGRFPLQPTWRARWEPVKNGLQLPEPDPFQDDVEYSRPVPDLNASGQTIDPNPDSAEVHALLRIELVRTVVDASGKPVPVVISPAEAEAELVKRFSAFVDLRLPPLFEEAAKRGIHAPSEASLNTIMRRYVLKQFRCLDSVEIAACEARGDIECLSAATDEERRDVEADRSQRRDVDDAIKQVATMLGVPARRFPAGRRPKRLYRNIVHRKE